MEPITETRWDVLIAGTGLPQSLLALALSRSDKRVLHVDKNDFYGGADAALTLQDAGEWADQVNVGNAPPYKNARINRYEEQGNEQLGSSRAYSLALAPQIIYTRSALLPTLVSSKVYRQLEFLAVGSWFVYGSFPSEGQPSLGRIPNSREDVFADKSLDMKAKRSLISFLRSIRDPEEQTKLLADHGNETLSGFLSSRYKLADSLQSAVAALTLTPLAVSQTTVDFALPRIARHLASIGVFGPGFGAVIPRWGGLSELAQVACRAQAVGGGTYILGKGIQEISAEATDVCSVTLDSDIKASADLVCASLGDLPGRFAGTGSRTAETRSIAIVAAGLDRLFVGASEGGPKPTVAVVCFPEGSLEVKQMRSSHPVYLMVHSSETGECPPGQCVIYLNMRNYQSLAQEFLTQSLEKLLASENVSMNLVLWTLQFEREELTPAVLNTDDQCHVFKYTSLDLAFNDEMLEHVRTVWKLVAGEEDGFMDFQDREVGAYDDMEED